MRSLHAWGLILMALFAFSTANAAEEENCEKCTILKTQLDTIETDKRNQIYLLEKNRQYLASLSGTQQSKRIKTNSNIFWINKKLEDIENDLAEIREDLQSKNCNQCK